ncbi:transposase, partial [Dehalococcoidia bacterium]|nr:transposase [Dehalococcoidia bacterium]
LPPYSPDLNPIEYIWKSIKRIISTMFIRHIDEMRNIIKEAFYRLSQKLSFAAQWIDKFLSPCYNTTLLISPVSLKNKEFPKQRGLRNGCCDQPLPESIRFGT